MELTPERRQQIEEEEKQRLAEDQYRAQVRASLASASCPNPPQPTSRAPKPERKRFDVRWVLAILAILIVGAIILKTSSTRGSRGPGGVRGQFTVARVSPAGLTPEEAAAYARAAALTQSLSNQMIARTQAANLSWVQANVPDNPMASDKAQPAQETSVPSFTAPVTSAATAEAFESFVDRDRGKVVHLNVEMGVQFSRVGDKIQGKDDLFDDLFVAAGPCDESQPVLDCAGSHYLLSGGDYVLEFYQGNNRLNGYFVINENTENHQGVYYILKSVSAAQVLLQTQRGKQQSVRKR
jgi:hypothetical protein